MKAVNICLKFTSVKLKKSPIEPVTTNALSIVSSSLGRHGEHEHPIAEPDGQQILLTVSQEGWSFVTVELKPQHVKDV
jgi:hypothetical protein